MPDFTMPLKRLIEINKGKIGLDTYPIFSEAHREVLNNKIIRHYYTREIGMESSSLFVYRLETKMLEIMPAYNELYQSKLIEIDPLSTINIDTLTTSTGKQTSDVEAQSVTSSENESVGESVSSDFPQNVISPEGNYATVGSKSESNANVEGRANESSLTENVSEDESVNNVKGMQGDPNALLRSFRANIINIDLQIIMECEDLFMGVFGTGDSYTPQPYLGGYFR